MLVIMTQRSPLDNYDRRILRILVEDGRITWRDLADRIGLSLTPTVRRVRLLEEQGYVTGYSARLDETLLAGSISVFVSVTLERHTRDVMGRFEERIADIPEVMGAFQMSGGADYLLRVVVRDLDHYRELLDTMTCIVGVAHLQSSFALKPIVNRSAPIVADRFR